MDIWQILMTPFSWILKQFIVLFDSYGIALILFTVIIKLILFPFSLKSKRSMIQMNILSEQQKEIQRRYPNDRMKQQEALSKLYADNGVNPTSGCLWSLVPMFILFPLYAVIRRPFKYLFGLTEAATEAVAAALGMADFSATARMGEVTLASLLNSDTLATASTAAESSDLFLINFNFFGVDLSQTPTLKFWEGGISWAAVGLFLLPVISACMSLVSMVVTQKTNALNKNQEDAAKKQSRWMMIYMPVISLWIGFTLPAAMCIYWIANSVLSMVQELVAGKMLKKDYAEAQRKMEEQAAKSKAYEKEQRRLAAERKYAAINDKKAPKKSSGAGKDTVNAADSRVGIRTYARGRAYDPNRYPITPYRDPNGPTVSSEEQSAGAGENDGENQN